MRGRGIALGKVPKNPGMDQWMPDPEPVDPDLYDFSKYFDMDVNHSYHDWYDANPCNLQPMEPEYTEEKISFALRMWSPPILVSFGVVSNLLSAYIMCEFSDKHLSSTLYITLLSLMEILVLVLRSGNDWMKTVYQIDFTNWVLLRSNAACEVYSFFTSFIYHQCSWLVVIPVAEMAIMSRDFSRAHKICTTSRIKNTVLLTVFFVIFVNAHFFFTYALLGPAWDPMCGQRQCTFIPGGWGEMFRDWLWPILGVNIFALLGPILSIFTCLVYILFKSDCGVNRSAKTKIFENRFLINNEALWNYRIICIVMSVFFLCTALPEASYNMYEFLLEKVGNNENTDAMSYVKRELAATTCSFLRDLFLSTKILIYAACWRRFRKRLLQCFSGLNCKHWLNNKKDKERQRYLTQGESGVKGKVDRICVEETTSLTRSRQLRHEHCV